MSSSPQRSLQSLSWLSNTVDTMSLLAAHDKSAKEHSSFSYYTKRTILASILSSSDLYLCQDTSFNSIETKKYIRARLNDCDLFDQKTRGVSFVFIFYELFHVSLFLDSK